MYDIKINNKYFVTLSSVIFVTIIFNLCIRNEKDFSYLVLDINDVSCVLMQGKEKIVGQIIINRLKQFIIFVLLLKAFGATKLYNSILVAIGGLIGLLISCQIYYQGGKGVIILLVYIMPHFLIYYLGLYYSFRVRMFDEGFNDTLRNY